MRWEPGMAEAPSAVTPPSLLTLDLAAPLVPCALASLKTPSFREKLGIPYYRIGGRIFYDPADIVRWREGCRVEPVPA